MNSHKTVHLKALLTEISQTCTMRLKGHLSRFSVLLHQEANKILTLFSAI